MTVSNPRLFGVDFSGAATPGNSIWISNADPTDDLVRFTDCRPAWKYLDLPRSAPRPRIYECLMELVAAHPTGVFGFDFPFGLPQSILGTGNSWRSHIETISDRFDTKSPDHFRRSCVDRALNLTGQNQKYLRRETDFRYAAMCPYQQQIQYQTLYGQAEFLRPLINRDEARVLPMQEQAAGKPVIVEVYPAATLGVLRLYRHGYKNHKSSRLRRKRILDGINARCFSLPDDVVDRCLDSDDALDSVLCTIAASHAVADGFPEVEEEAQIEGQIFA